ncbi:hypothetical protein K431DRAFT_119043 [Polychaeton citri CBS 116435]|uniref:RING-CH-type domain-containing protein n=1 Tax=Polychaeton citri CBS 116435 TaxID=1314669 RepID=A0A9P4QHZ7_9PEZI|nr:hypothetical protein K431DRAFT_119043 [Polychaeton citri CBS 116435]
MASLPQQPAPQTRRRASPEESTDASTTRSDAAHQSFSRLRTRSATSEDSHTVVLSDPSASVDEAVEQESQAKGETQDEEEGRDAAASTTAAPQWPGPIEDDSAKKCWICFSDSTEDTPETSPWRNPCPCALEAHEECLLDWIADLEATNRKSGRGSSRVKVLCPQCKNEIKLDRPKDLVVEAIQELEKLGHKMVTPSSVAVLINIMYQASTAHGIWAVRSVFGSEDSLRILEPLILSAVRSEDDPQGMLHESVVRVLDALYNHWRLYLGLPLITPVLMLSRTRSRFADAILPLLPVFFFATQSYSPDEPLDFDIGWPPTAGFAFSVLPYVRSAYNFYFEKAWGQKQRQWLKELQPRSTQELENNETQQDAGENPADVQNQEARNIFELRIDGDIWDDWAEGGEQQPADAPVPGAGEAAQAAPGLDNQDGRQQPQANEADGVNNNNNNNGQRQGNQVAQAERRYSLDPLAIAETVLGALIFPKVSQASGELLKLILPAAWTTPPSVRGKATGLLQQKWGRSLVGGCMFVVAKDILLLYVRWRMAKLHRQRKVLDYRRSEARTA